jgi:hypothetical protein
MRPVTLTQTGVGSTAAIPVDYLIAPFSIGFAVKAGGTVNYTVEHTYDDPFGATFGSATWFPHSTVAAQTATKEGSYTTPIRALCVTVNSGTGTAALTVVQAGIVG